jgi:hypothetical protein
VLARKVQCAPFLLRTDNGEEEASGNSSVVGGGCEDLKGSCESENLGASGGEEAASYSERGRTKSYEAGGEIHIHHSKAAVEAQVAIGKIATDSKAPWLRVRNASQRRSLRQYAQRSHARKIPVVSN